MTNHIIFLLSLTFLSGCNQAPQPASTQPQPVVKMNFVLNAKVATLGASVALTQLETALGEPISREPSPYSCDSAFDEGQVMLHKYANFTVETDGQTAVVRSLSMSGGNQIKLGAAKPQSELTIDAFERAFGARASQIGGAMRVTGVAPESEDSAYDFSFADTKLNLVEYWIAC